MSAVIHLASDDETTTMCGRKFGSLNVSDGAVDDTTCKTCIRSYEAEAR